MTFCLFFLGSKIPDAVPITNLNGLTCHDQFSLPKQYEKRRRDTTEVRDID